jgi:dTDP-glucose pyrophosphorylase/CBS domain-containing protein
MKETIDIKHLLCRENITIKDALKILNQAETGCLIVVDDKGKLLGTLSDGDVRRSILLTPKISNSIEACYYKSPYFLLQDQYSERELKTIFFEKEINIIPIVDSNHFVVGYKHNFGYLQHKAMSHSSARLSHVPVVVMAGGKGTRMEPFTSVLPKPLIPVHEKPIIDHIIDRFTELGCKNFYLSVNYKSRILKAYFEEQQRNYHVDFIEEDKPLGTAGSLHYLVDRFNCPFFVTNCDILVETDYVSLYNYHKQHGYDLTLVASAKEYVIPYGTCEVDNEGYFLQIDEKPKYDFLVNTGLYVLNPEVLNRIPQDVSYDITDLISDLNACGKTIGVYPIDDDSWTDIGQWTEFRKALAQL